jgi:hypothetical protein
MVARLGLGVYLAIPEDHGAVADVLVSASTSAIPSMIQAEAQALLLASHIASSMMLQAPVFFIDCSNLAGAATAHGANSQASLWEIRSHAIEFQHTMASMSAKIFHIKETSVSPLTVVHIRPSLPLALGLSVPAGSHLIDP